MLHSSVRVVGLGLALLAEPCASQHLRGRAPKSMCALGENIRVVTDMGFDDWGAFSVLNAAGCTPQKALGVEGMMPPGFAGNFSKLLKSWGLGTQVYVDMDLPSGTCYRGSPCVINETSRPGWWKSYRANIYTSLPGATGRPWSEVETSHDDVSRSVQDFWSCTKGEEYTLLIIGPQTAAAKQFTGPLGPNTSECIKEIVYMGGLFANAQLANNDPATFDDAAVGPASSASLGFPKPASGSPITEVNVLSDIAAAKAMWVSMPSWISGITQWIFSLEVASYARAGLNYINLTNGTAPYGTERQVFWDDQIFNNETRAKVVCDTPKTMLAKMSCINDHDHNVLHFDAIAATYLWLGDTFEELSISFKQINVSIDDDGVTMPLHGDSSPRNHHGGRIFLAQNFNAIAWLQRLGEMLHA